MVSHGAFDATKMCALGVRASGVSIDPAGTDTTDVREHCREQATAPPAESRRVPRRLRQREVRHDIVAARPAQTVGRRESRRRVRRAAAAPTTRAVAIEMRSSSPSDLVPDVPHKQLPATTWDRAVTRGRATIGNFTLGG